MPPFTSTYPTTVDTSVTLGEVANNAETTLSSSLSDVATTANVVSTSLFPTTGAFSVNSEIIYYTGKTGTSFTGLIRGSDGTTAATHASGDDVAGNIIARHHAVLAEALIATQTELDTKLATADAFTQADADGLYSVLGHTHSFASLTSKPTTISGYGITDAYTKTEIDDDVADLIALIGAALDQSEADALYSPLGHTHTFASLTSKPTTIAGYGITDFNSLGDARWLGLHDTADLATALATPRNINGVAFDGTANITVAAAAGTLTGTTLAANVVTSSLTSVGTIATGVWQGTAIASGFIGSHNHAAADINSGTIATARLGSGTADNTTYLRGDQTWATVSASDATKLPLAGGTMTGQITSTLGTITTDIRALSATATWNASGTTFYGIFQNITATAFAAASRLLELQVGGSEVASVTKEGWFRGSVTSSRDSVMFGSLNGLHGINVFSGDGAVYVVYNGTAWAQLAGASTRIQVLDTGKFSWSQDTGPGSSPDTALMRGVAGRVDFTNGTAGTFRDWKARDGILTAALNVQGAAASVASGISIGGATRTTVGAAGGATALPATPTGYLDWYVGSTAIGIPYYVRGA